MPDISIVIPAKNEANGLASFLPILKALYSDAEIIVVNDGSTDNTSEVCQKNDVIEIINKYSLGNGGAIKAGARCATKNIVVFMDGDGQHDPKDIERLVAEIENGYDMVVGARDKTSQASVGRSFANRFYNRLASWMVRQKVEDLTSGFRAVKREKFLEFLHLLPNGFSYPTTSTMAFFRSGYAVKYIPIIAHKRIGKSHINVLKDGMRFLLIIFKIGTLFSPLKLFVPISASLFATGVLYYFYTFVTAGRFTNMSATILSASLLVFLIGLVSEQITQLVYKK
ncbi:MAG: glycosyltransferase family 2 protein [Gammaproteobacteria bacterium]|nr:MAG: glycosyltransferase family 2 protein [Gammaproteobacteria bacterium]